MTVRRSVPRGDELTWALRAELRRVDRALIAVLAERHELVGRLWDHKRAVGRPLEDRRQEARVLAAARASAPPAGPLAEARRSDPPRGNRRRKAPGVRRSALPAAAPSTRRAEASSPARVTRPARRSAPRPSRPWWNSASEEDRFPTGCRTSARGGGPGYDFTSAARRKEPRAGSCNCWKSTRARRRFPRSRPSYSNARVRKRCR